MDAYLILLSHVLGPYGVTLATPYTISISQDRFLNPISNTQVSLGPTYVQSQDDKVHKGYNQYFSTLLAETLEKGTIKQCKAKTLEVREGNILSTVSSNMSAMADDGNMWCDGMDTCLLTICWNHPRLVYSTASTTIGRRSENRKNQRRPTGQI